MEVSLADVEDAIMRFRVALLLMGVLVASTLAVPASAASPRSVQIVFSGADTEAPGVFVDLWTMDGLGKDVVRLTNDPGADFEPAWSPDGANIAWVHYEEYCNCGPGQIMVMDADGSNRHPITAPGGYTAPSWSPDGERIAFMNDYAIWIMNADGTGAHAISPPGSFEFDPDWSPDGSTILFVRSRPSTSDVDLAMMSPDGTDRRWLTRTPRVFEEHPAWSPDGERIALGGIDRRTSWHVFAADPHTGELAILVEMFSLYPAWFPDGSRIAFYGCELDLFCGLGYARANGEHPKAFARIGVDGTDSDIVSTSSK